MDSEFHVRENDVVQQHLEQGARDLRYLHLAHFRFCLYRTQYFMIFGGAALLFPSSALDISNLRN